MKKFENLEVEKEIVKRGIKRCGKNDEIADFYLELGENRFEPCLVKRYYALRNCFKTWTIDYYKNQKVKDVKKVIRCKDIFCLNCQSQLSSNRAMKYTPYLDKIGKEYDIYHVTHTVPDPLGPKLKETVDRMYEKFPYLVQYMQGSRKARGIDFSFLGFVGAVRTLEITSHITDAGIEYHPHFHCYYILRKGIKGLCKPNMKNINSFSFKRGKSGIQRIFSDFEIFLQKVWYLLYNGIKLNLKNIEDLTEGYSCTVDKVKPGQYHEVFKYVIKGTFKDNVFAYDYDAFRYLYDTLHRRKIIQGYGILNRFTFSDEEAEELTAERIAEYDRIVSELKAQEKPWEGYENVTDVLANMGAGITYISKRKIAKSIKPRESNKK